MQMLVRTVRIFLGALCLIAAGCSTPITYYKSAPDLTAETAATISGTKQENPNPLTGDVRIYATHIDGVPIQRTNFGWDELVLVSPGIHLVRIQLMRRDPWRPGSISAEIEQTVEMGSGKLYAARGELKGREATLWLEEVGSAREQARTVTPVVVFRPVVVPIIVR